MVALFRDRIHALKRSRQMQGKTQPIDRDLAETAADWLLLLHEQRHDPARAVALKSRIADWCAEAPAHDAAFTLAQRAWHVAGHLPATAPTLPPAPIPFRRTVPSRSVVLGAAAALLAVAAAVILALPTITLHWQADHLTSTGGSETAQLEDGTTITLAAESAIRTHFSATARDVDLLAGEAYFDVAHDAARPFRIAAGATEIEVLGTAFDVDLSSQAITVSVARGRVAVRPATDATQFLILQAGDSVTIDRDTGNAQTGRAAPDQIAAWRQGQLVVEGAPIGAIVEKLGRYHDGMFLVTDADLAARRVTGVFDLRDPAKALRALADAQGGRLVGWGNLITALTPGD